MPGCFIMYSVNSCKKSNGECDIHAHLFVYSTCMHASGIVTAGVSPMLAAWINYI